MYLEVFGWLGWEQDHYCPQWGCEPLKWTPRGSESVADKEQVVRSAKKNELCVKNILLCVCVCVLGHVCVLLELNTGPYIC